MKIEELQSRVNALIQLAHEVLSTSWSSDFSSGVDPGKFRQLRAASLSFLKKTFGSDHPYYIDFNEKIFTSRIGLTSEALGILLAAKDEIDGGWLYSVKGLISAEIFSDFMEMAEHLISQNYKDPAAVLIGGVLEEHLRQLCLNNNIDTEFLKDDGSLIPKKASSMNVDLYKAEIYTKLDQKSINSWLDLRNNAAHGKYDEYNIEQVKTMYYGISEFLVRVTLK